MPNLIDLLITWIETPDWAASEAFLRSHEADLLTDTAENVLAAFQQSHPTDLAVIQHIDLLHDCRSHGVTEAYLERTSGPLEEPPVQDDRLLLVALFNANNPLDLAELLDTLPDGESERMVQVTEEYLQTVTDPEEFAAVQERLTALKELLSGIG